MSVLQKTDATIQYQAVCQFKDSLEGEGAIASSEEVFEWWPKKTHNHSLVPLFSSKPERTRDTRWRSERLVDLPFLGQFRMIWVQRFHLHCHTLSINDIACKIYVSCITEYSLRWILQKKRLETHQKILNQSFYEAYTFHTLWIHQEVDLPSLCVASNKCWEELVGRQQSDSWTTRALIMRMLKFEHTYISHFSWRSVLLKGGIRQKHDISI